MSSAVTSRTDPRHCEPAPDRSTPSLSSCGCHMRTIKARSLRGVMLRAYAARIPQPCSDEEPSPISGLLARRGSSGKCRWRGKLGADPRFRSKRRSDALPPARGGGTQLRDSGCRQRRSRARPPRTRSAAKMALCSSRQGRQPALRRLRALGQQHPLRPGRWRGRRVRAFCLLFLLNATPRSWSDCADASLISKAARVVTDAGRFFLTGSGAYRSSGLMPFLTYCVRFGGAMTAVSGLYSPS
jgi:hypothetical protein